MLDLLIIYFVFFQLRRILRHKCDVPNPNQIVDIQFNYETNFLSQYISSLGQILVDSQPIPGSSSNTNVMLPMPQAVAQSPVVSFCLSFLFLYNEVLYLTEMDSFCISAAFSFLVLFYALMLFPLCSPLSL